MQTLGTVRIPSRLDQRRFCLSCYRKNVKHKKKKTEKFSMHIKEYKHLDNIRSFI